jgi:hypothetical protein
MQAVPKASSMQQQLFCKFHQFLQKMQLGAKYLHYSHKPYTDQDMQDTVEGNLECSPQGLQGDARWDLSLLQQNLLAVQIRTFLCVAPSQ